MNAIEQPLGERGNADTSGVHRIATSVARCHIDQTHEVMAVAEALAQTVADLITRENLFPGNAKRHAFVSYVTPDYRWGMVVWLRSLRKVSTKPVILLVSKPIEIPAGIAHVHQIVVPPLLEESYRSDRSEFKNVLAKLWTFALTPLSRVFFIDIDCVILGPIDHLFDRTEFLVCPDYVEHRTSERFNSGVLVFTPATTLRDHVFATAPGVESDDGGDQGLLNVILANRVTFIEERYNLLRHFYYYAAKSPADGTRIVHYIVKKPWELQYRETPDGLLVELDDIWTAFLTRDELLDLIKDWRRSIFHISERARIESIRGPTLLPLTQRLEALEREVSDSNVRLKSWGTLVVATLLGAAFMLLLRKIVG